MIGRSVCVVILSMVMQGAVLAQESPAVRVDPNVGGFAALSVADIASSASWYERHFGLSREFSHTSKDGSVRILVLSRQGLTIELQQHSAAQPLPPPEGKGFLRHGIFKFGVGVTDVREAAAKLKAAGVTILVKPFEDQGGRYVAAIIRDNSGNVIQLFQKAATKPKAK